MSYNGADAPDAEITFTFEASCPDDAFHAMTAGIEEHAQTTVGLPPPAYFSMLAHDSDGALAGGLQGAFYYGACHVNFLWVDPAYRQQGIATTLMEWVEEYAIEQGVGFLTLHTMSWEARGFYEKLGFIVEYSQSGYTGGAVRHCMRKALPKPEEGVQA
jgi:ribosomal protein S18 acetylase RimI-like enzyme